MSSALLLAACLLASAPPVVEAPKGPVVIETKRGKLVFSHQAHGKTACAGCHKDQEVPGRLGLKGKEAAHKLCLACHRSEKKGPQGCTSCHER
jgi:hypothetical protein